MKQTVVSSRFTMNSIRFSESAVWLRASLILPRCSKRLLMPQLRLVAPNVAGSFERSHRVANFTCQTVSGPLGIALQNCSLVNIDELTASGTDQQIIRVDDLAADNRPFPISPHLPIRSFLALSVRNSTGEIAGALAFAHRSPAIFTERTERILAVVALQASVGLENAQLYRSAQAASAAKDQFLAILSHELRTPLTPIFAILATIGRYPDLPEIIRSDLLVISRNLQLEARLIDDLLDLTRINKGKILLLREIVDVHDLIRSVRQLCQVAIDTQQVCFEMQLDAPSLSCARGRRSASTSVLEPFKQRD